jgi:hypothetical protein
VHAFLTLADSPLPPDGLRPTGRRIAIYAVRALAMPDLRAS